MLSARYRRAVAEAFVWLQGNGNGQGVEPVIDLCGDDGADPAADGDGSGTFFSARQVGAWIRTHASDTLTDRWDWYDRVTRALSGLVRDGFVCVGPGVGGLFRLGDTAEGRRVTTLLTLRWKDKEDMALEVSSSCTDLKLREIVSRKTGGRLPAVKIELTYPGLFDKKRDTMGALSDDTVVTLLIGKDLTQKPKTQRTPSASIVADPNASPIDEVFEHEAEGTKGWNDNNDGWVNLVVNENGEESDDEDDEDGEFTLTRSSGGAKKMSAKKPAATASFAETNTSRAEVDCSKLLATVGTRGGKASNTSAPAPATALAVFDDNGDDDELSPKSKLFSPVAAARAFRLNNDDDELDEDLGERPRKRGRSSTPAKNGVVDLTGEDDSKITQENDRSASDSALSGSENSDSDSDSDESLDDHAGRLHDQILTFAELNGSDRDDGIRRELCRKTVQACVQRVFPSASLEVFGSGASGLALREADIDLVILGVGPTAATAGGGFNKHDRQELVSILRKIEKQLRKDRVVVRALGVYTAKVPIVKAHTTGNDNSGFNLDLTVGATNGLKAVRWIKQQVVEFPELRPLVLVVKKLLKTHGLDDASTGGCGGYLLVSLAVAHLKMNKQGTGGLGNTPTAQKGGTPTVDQKAPQTTDLGFVLTSFLRRFGGDGFDFAKSAVAANRSAGLMRASEVVVTVGPYGKRPFILCEDPQEVGRNITASAYRFKEVRSLFRATAEAIATEGDLTFLPEVAGGGGGHGGGMGNGTPRGSHNMASGINARLNFDGGGGAPCFKCNQSGHFARDCPSSSSGGAPEEKPRWLQGGASNHPSNQNNTLSVNPQRGFKSQWHRPAAAAFSGRGGDVRARGNGGAASGGSGGGKNAKSPKSARSASKSPGGSNSSKGVGVGKKKGTPGKAWNVGVRSTVTPRGKNSPGGGTGARGSGASRGKGKGGGGTGGGGRGWSTE